MYNSWSNPNPFTLYVAPNGAIPIGEKTSLVFIFAVAGGGGGASGWSDVAGSTTTPGACGGGGGGTLNTLHPTYLLPKTLYAIHAQAGEGGAASRGASAGGTAGGDLNVYMYPNPASATEAFIRLTGGGGATATTTGAVGTGGSTGTCTSSFFRTLSLENSGGSGNSGALNSTGANLTVTNMKVSGGAGGAGITTTNLSVTGGNVLGIQSETFVVSQASPNAGSYTSYHTDPNVYGYLALPGSGGWSGSSAPGGNGGNGGYGCGGGGGGGSHSVADSGGSGGSGGPAALILVEI